MLKGVIRVLDKYLFIIDVEGTEGRLYDRVTRKQAKENYIRDFGIKDKIEWIIEKESVSNAENLRGI